MEQGFSPNYNKRSSSAIIDMIIIHYTVINLQQTIRVFKDKNKQVSSHYVIAEDGKIFQPVLDKYRAWHAGVSYFAGRKDINSYSIGIELVNNGKEEFTTQQYKALESLIKLLKNQHPIKDHYILGHSDVAPQRKIDPGKFFAWQKLAAVGHGFYVDLAVPDFNAEIVKLYSKNIQVKNLQTDLKNFGYEISNDGIFGPKTLNVIKSFKTHFCPKTNCEIWDNYAHLVLHQLSKKLG